jgi:hypothetical protein
MPFNRPSDAICSVLRKIGVDPNERLTESCQDPEYTACRSEEIAAYFDLYLHGDVDQSEREVLCCFLLQELNELCAEGASHALQVRIFDALFDAGDIHAEELIYWMKTDDPDSQNWWPVAAYLLQHRDCLRRESGPAGQEALE